ncbi:L-lactate dehydrogenase complex protein LldG [Saccharothrix tamanrassetensis]|uniref:L-lactate dehydrogenase complex protein LldG n=1 Tax=Saccharothrix tamanrassetensis TaxID=1051531 RepID=A0A841CA19_9PSEU|nr:LUD domain-containing protein [Saccharothrix tamanrassetensis]MBB5953810.1 L-lactate dehydrogenase complex protein LldG [Saccharothrix tamanrassetensis]
MSTARSEILARITAALGHRPPAPPVPRDYRRSGSLGPGDVERFADRLRDYRAVVHFTSAAGLADTIAEALRRRGARHVVAAPGVPTAWAPDAIRSGVDSAALEGTDAVITACHVAIAETGTIVLDHDAPDQGIRALTLLPDYHLVVVRRQQVVAGVPDAVTALAGVRTQTWISGPSATSDIELERVEGVHGPRTLEVVVTR